MNTADFLLQAGDPASPALLTPQAEHSYGEVKRAAARLAGELCALGAGPGALIPLLSENSLFFVAGYLAILKIGAVAVPLPTIAASDELHKKLEFFQGPAILAERRLLRRQAAAVQAAGRLVLTDEVLSQPGPSAWDDLSAATHPDQDTVLMLTSGTTAQPRAVRITHGNIQANTASIIAYLELTCRDRMLAILPFYYCFGTSLLHTHLRAGGSLALCNTFAYPETALDMLADQACTGFAGVPSTFQILLRNTTFPRRRFPALQKIQQAGGKLQPALIQELASAAAPARLYVMYGQTEATARLSYLPPELLGTRLGSIGKGIPGVTLQVLDEAGQPVRPGEVGEIIASGENISPGYYQEPEASAQKFAGGRLHTGDLATVDEDGFIYIVDRKEDFIKSFGHRVSSQEIEACLIEIPAVVSAAAVGLPDPLQGEAIHAFVTLQSGVELSEAEILAHCRQKLARHMLPNRIWIVACLPVNAHGKIMKSQLRQWAAEKTSSSAGSGGA